MTAQQNKLLEGLGWSLPSDEDFSVFYTTTKIEVDHMVPVTKGVCISKVVEGAGVGFATYRPTLYSKA